MLFVNSYTVIVKQKIESSLCTSKIHQFASTFKMLFCLNTQCVIKEYIYMIIIKQLYQKCISGMLLKIH